MVMLLPVDGDWAADVGHTMHEENLMQHKPAGTGEKLHCMTNRICFSRRPDGQVNISQSCCCFFC